MPDHLGDDMRKVKDDGEKEVIKGEEQQLGIRFLWLIMTGKFMIGSAYTSFYFIPFAALDEGDIAILKTYVRE